MKAVTAAKMFMFTLVFYCIFVVDDSPQRFERGAQIFQQWTVVSAAKASSITDEMAFEVRGSVRAAQRVLKPIGLDRYVKVVRQRVTSRATLIRAYAADRLAPK